MEKDRRLEFAKFRVKIKSLAAEARIIRGEVRKLEQAACTNTEYLSTLDNEPAKQAKVLRQIWYSHAYAGTLANHNRSVVAKEMRATLMAYAFLRDRWKSVDTARPHMLAKDVARVLKSLCYRNESELTVANWLFAAAEKKERYDAEKLRQAVAARPPKVPFVYHPPEAVTDTAPMVELDC